MADWVWKGVQPKVIGHFEPLLLNKFFDPSTPSMRKGRDGEWKMEKKKYQPSGAGGTRSPPATPTACNAAEANLHPPNLKTKITSL